MIKHLLFLSFFYVNVAIASDSLQEARQKTLDDAKKAYAKAIDLKNVNNVPLWEMLPQTSAAGRIDYQQISQLSTSEKQSSATKVIVFISFSMPEESIKRLIIEASNSKKPEAFKFVLNGLDAQTKSLLKTQQKIASLSKGHNVEVDIDPGEFEVYDIKRVPAFVIYKDDPLNEAQCAIDGKKQQTGNSYKVYGDVSIVQAVNHMIRQIKPEDIKNQMLHLVDALSSKL